MTTQTTTEPRVVLRGVVGSTAYGLATPDSDVDRLGVFVAPAREVLGLSGTDAVKTSHVTNHPDQTLHELAKFMRLALAGNPTVTELLWLTGYEVQTEAGAALVAARRSFLSRRRVLDAYTGYATQQATRLLNRHEQGKEGFSSDLARRTAKHGRHCLRLLMQSEDLLRTGSLTLDMSARRDELFAAGDLAANDPAAFHAKFVELRANVEAIDSVLPEQPDTAAVDDLLVSLRLADLG